MHWLGGGLRFNEKTQCRINNGANGAAAPGPPQLGAPHKGFFLHTNLARDII